MNIRYHHLMCIPRFKGKGYSTEFCENMQKIKTQIEQGKNFKLVSHTDEICKCCPNNTQGICSSEDKVQHYDEMVKTRLENHLPLNISEICTDCQWYAYCKEINIT